jgi:hypothetical protein
MAIGRKTGGRSKGVPNKRAAALREKIAQCIDVAGLDPVEFMLAIMTDHKQALLVRFEAAKAVAPYVHPRKVDHGEDRPANNTTVIIGGITDADRIEAVRQLLGKDRK